MTTTGNRRASLQRITYEALNYAEWVTYSNLDPEAGTPDTQKMRQTDIYLAGVSTDWVTGLQFYRVLPA